MTTNNIMFRKPEDTNPVPAAATTTTALALHRHTRSHRILLENAIELMALVKMVTFVPKSQDKAEAIRERAASLEYWKGQIRSRLVMDESKRDPVTGKATEPLVVCVPIVPAPKRSRGVGGRILGWSASAWIKIPKVYDDDLSVEAVPFVKQGMELIYRRLDGYYETTGEHYFFVLRPEEKFDEFVGEDGVKVKKARHNYYKLFPLGACDEKLLKTLNDLHLRDGNLDQIIVPLKHDIRKPGASRTVIHPTRDEPWSDTDQRRRWIGDDCGMRLKTTLNSPPPHFQPDGSCPDYVATYWEGEGIMIVELIGEVGVVDLETREFKSEMGYAMDPIAFTGLDIMTIDPDDVAASVAPLRDLPMGPENPGWRALAMNPDPADNLIDPSKDDVFFQERQVEEGYDTAVVRLKAMLDSAFKDIIDEFVTVPAFSDLDLGEDVDAALALTGEVEDGAVRLIRERFGGYNHTSPMHRKVRRAVIELSAGRMAAPEPKKVEATPTRSIASGTPIMKVSYKGKINNAKPDVDCRAILQITADTPEELFQRASTAQVNLGVIAEVVNAALAEIGSDNFLSATDEGDKKKLETIFMKARDQAVNWAKERIGR